MNNNQQTSNGYPLTVFDMNKLDTLPDIKTIWENKVGKVVLITAGTVGLGLALGGGLHLLAFIRRGYTKFRDAGKSQNQ